MRARQGDWRMLGVALFFGSVAMFLGLILMLTLYVAIIGPNSWNPRPIGVSIMILTLVTAVACAYTCFRILDGQTVVRWALVSSVLVLMTISIVLSVAPGWFTFL
jgi:hypothetical protein